MNYARRLCFTFFINSPFMYLCTTNQQNWIPHLPNKEIDTRFSKQIHATPSTCPWLCLGFKFPSSMRRSTFVCTKRKPPFKWKYFISFLYVYVILHNGEFHLSGGHIFMHESLSFSRTGSLFDPIAAIGSECRFLPCFVPLPSSSTLIRCSAANQPANGTLTCNF